MRQLCSFLLFIHGVVALGTITTGPFVGQSFRFLQFYESDYPPYSGDFQFLVVSDHGCTVPANSSYANTIVAPPSVAAGECNFNELSRNWKAAGATGVVWRYHEKGTMDMSALRIFDRSGTPIPMYSWDISTELQDYLDTQVGMLVDVRVNVDENWFLANRAIVLPFEIFMLIFSFTNIVFCIWGLARVLRIALPMKILSAFSIPITALTFELISNIVHFIFWIDPVFANRILISDLWSFCQTLGFPFTIGTTILIVFYWRSVLSKTKSGKNYLQRVSSIRIPAFVLISLIIALEIAQDFLRVFGSFSTVALSTAVISSYSLILFCLSIFYLVTAIRVLRTLRSVVGKKEAVVTRLSRLVFILVAGVVIMFIGTGLAATRSYRIASFYYASTFMSQLGFMIVSSSLITVFSTSALSTTTTMTSGHSGSSSRETSRTGIPSRPSEMTRDDSPSDSEAPQLRTTESPSSTPSSLDVASDSESDSDSSGSLHSV